ncbi:MAG: class I SAM-dependent methyltransferase [Nocardioides sp.]|nr:class I SAM-dependent methyltransferase [Nocardioides sp.]
MGLWEKRVVPRLVDWSLRAPEIGELRTEVCAGLRGEVLEIGFGSGLNTRFYPGQVSTVNAVEPSDVAWHLSERRRATSRVPVVRVGLDGQSLAADDASYDAVLSTFTLCTIPDVTRALAEVRRVLRPGGALHFVEHGLAPEPGVVAWQSRLEPMQRRLAGGCHLSRDIPALVRDAGLEIEELREEYLDGPRVARPWTYGYLGRATA